VEVSYVDRPCNPTSTIGIAKMVGAELAAVESETPGTAWLAKKVVKPADTDKAATIDSLFARIDSLEKALKKPGASGTGKDSSGKSIADVPDEDFAGPNGTFPIRQPADVADAASLAHHADDPAAVRAKIKAIAKRKFAMKGKDMPPSLKKDKTVTAEKSATPAKSLKKLVKAAVAESTAALTARAEAAEQKLAEISKTVQPGGPRPMGYAPKTNEAAAQQARVDRFKRLASSTSDRELSKGYEELAKKAEADLTK